MYTGADDGTLQMTRDGGSHWKDLTGNLRGVPAMLNISSIVASKHAAARVYVTVDGHFNDDYHPYVYVSEDYGGTWRPIVDGLPQASVHRLREHPTNPNYLVTGLEAGAYATFDRGVHWTALGAKLPPVPVYDLLFQESEGALVLGTHGRSIWVLDHAEPLAQITAQVVSGSYLFPVPPVHHETIYVGQFWFGAGEFFAPNPVTGAPITYFQSKSGGDAEISIADAAGQTIRTLQGPALAGLNRVHWDLRQTPAAGGLGPKVLPGVYTVTLSAAGGAPLKTNVTVLPDPRFPVSEADRQARHRSIMSVYTLQQQLLPARTAAQTLNQQVSAMRQYLSAAGDGGQIAMGAVEKAAPEVTRILGELNRTLNSAGRLETTMDNYDGLPTIAQLRELDWAWEDATALVAALNKLIQHDMPPVYAALGNSVKWPAVESVKPPAM